MTSQKNYPIKREYEDLDAICGASTDISFSHYRQPYMFASDTAINLKPEKLHSKKLSEQMNSVRTGSIPCLFRLGTDWPVLEDNQNKNRQVCDQSKNFRRKHHLWLICYIFVYCFYLGIGALCFQLIETPEKIKVQGEFFDFRKKFLLKYPQMEENDLDNILNAAVSVAHNSIKLTANSTNDVIWNFGDLILFTTSMVTTIGYGHLRPITNFGKIICIIYATIGIPLTLVLLSTMVEVLLKQTNKLLKLLIKKFRHLYQTLSIQILHLSITGLVFSILFIIIPAVIFSRIEPDWSMLDGIYFCFTSLTTIGMGDLIPDKADTYIYGSLYKTLTAIYIILGLIGIMVVVTIFYTIPQLNIGIWLVESNSNELNIISTLNEKSLNQNKRTMENIPTIKIESTDSSTKTLRTIA